MKPFDLEAAKAGAKVVNRAGCVVRLVCFDVDSHDGFPLVGIVRDTAESGEYIARYKADGGNCFKGISDKDLFMAPVKREGWVNINESRVYITKEKARASVTDYPAIVVKVEWEE